MRWTFLMGLLAVLAAAVPVGAQERVPTELPRGPLAEAASREARAIGVPARTQQLESAGRATEVPKTAIGNKAVVITVSGETIRGTVVEVSETGIVMSRDKDSGYDNFGNKVRPEVSAGNVQVTYDQARRISVRQPDSLKNGILTGLGVGAATGLGVIAVAYAAETSGSKPDPEERNAFLTAGALNGAIVGVLVGLIADAGRVKTTVVSPAQAGTPSASLTLLGDSHGPADDGTAINMAESGLRVSITDRVREFGQAEMRAMSRRNSDSLLQGVLIGAAGGIAVGALLRQSDEYWDFGMSSTAGYYLLFAGMGAGVGAVIDAVVPGSKLVNHSPAARGRKVGRLAISPIFARGRKEIAARFVF